MERKEKVRRGLRRHRRVRKRILGTPDRPRLTVFRSNRHIYAQVVDDFARRTIVSASSLKDANGSDPKERAKAVGAALAKRAKEAGVEKVAFDRGGFKFHGRVRALAEGAREGGLKF